MSSQLMEEKQNIKNSEDTMIFWSRVAWLNVFSMMKLKTDINASLLLYNDSRPELRNLPTSKVQNY